MVELVDTQDLGSCAFGCEGSSPSFGTVFIGSGPTRSPLPIRLVRRVWRSAALTRCRRLSVLHHPLLRSPDAAFSLPGAVLALFQLAVLAIYWLRANSKSASDPARSSRLAKRGFDSLPPFMRASPSAPALVGRGNCSTPLHWNRFAIASPIVTVG